MGEEMRFLGMLMAEVVPCILMATMEALTIALTILASTVIAKGISPFVFVAYTSALSSLFLLPSLTINSSRRTLSEQEEGSLFSLPLLVRIFILGLIGVPIAQNLAFLGLSYSSPIVACAMANLIPAISFILNILLRRTRIDWKSGSNKIKIVGTFISIVGALSTTFYKGPVVRKQSTHLLQLAPRLFVFMSPNEKWILGCALFASASLSFAIWNIIQVETVKLYPDVMKIASSYTLVGTLLTGIVALTVERDLSAWSLKLDMTLLVIVLTAIFGSVVRSNTQIWCTKVKGSFFVPLFKPFTVPYATFCGCYFFGDTFHYGSIMGATIVGVGYYTIMWGLMREGDEKSKILSAAANEESSEEKIPLLRDEEESQV
ncbi:WAT1-related protein At1g70260-like [Impatiens glandulifera]|uniref:WAT1-related protein At1g70260-like n=1 Tax=Impatiens glandulifera TaxID=253017 RepID=UPI001FB1A06C|nr:WAT1-related protein At1g70260-like [Impatiens glandulifera]